MNLIALTLAACLFVPSLAAAAEFKLGYDPLASLRKEQVSPADPMNQTQIRIGAAVYAEHCAVCHGAALEGAENWMDPEEDGTYKPPPHDDTGHTWHHSDKVLYEYVKLGGDEVFKDFPDIISNMPGFEDVLTDTEIWGVLAFIKASWSPQSRDAQRTSSSFDPLPDAYLPK